MPPVARSPRTRILPGSGVDLTPAHALTRACLVDSQALMIACCSPSPTALEETLTTLYYATRAKSIVNTPKVLARGPPSPLQRQIL